MSVATRRAIYGSMAADSTLNGLLGTAAPGYTKSIYFARAADDAGFPYIVFSKSSGVPTYTFKAGIDGLTNEMWLIKGVDHNTTADKADAIADRLRALLTDASLSISGRVHMSLRPESDVDYLETTDGEDYYHAGSLFRLIHEPT